MSEFWFARRFPVGHPRNAMAPVSPEGWSVVWVFVASMIIGAVLALFLIGLGAYLAKPLAFIMAPVVFIGLTVYSAMHLIRTSSNRGDHTRTVEDYKRMAQGSGQGGST